MKSPLFIAAFCAAESVLAGDAAIVCPPVLEVQEKAEEVDGWIAHEGQTPHKWYFAQFSDGHPSRQAILLNDKETRSGKDKVLHYEFFPSQEPWLICSYTGTNAVLARRLAPVIRSCKLILSYAHNFETVKAISCTG